MKHTNHIEVSREVAKEAVRLLLGDESILIFEANEEQKKQDIDYVVKTKDGREATIDLKVRRSFNKLLVVEVDVYNNQRRRPWLYNSKADYFLFAHLSKEEPEATFYLVRRHDLLKLVKQKEPAFRRVYVYKITDISLLYFYDYNDIRKVGKLYHVKLNIAETPNIV